MTHVTLSDRNSLFFRMVFPHSVVRWLHLILLEYVHWLVVSNIAFMTFHSVRNVIIPTDEVHHFSRWLKPPTSSNVCNCSCWFVFPHAMQAWRMRRERVAWWRLNGGNGANLGIAQSLDGLFHMQSPWEKMDDLGIEVPLQCEAPSYKLVYKPQWL